MSAIVANILEMVALTRFDCMVASAAGMRQAVAQATYHAAYRQAFSNRPDQHPLMQNVLADLAIESQTALALGFRTARALDHLADDNKAALFRLLTPIAGTGSSNDPRHMRLRPRKVWAAAAPSRRQSCRGSIGKPRSTRSGRAAAISSAWICFAPFGANPMRWRP